MPPLFSQRPGLARPQPWPLSLFLSVILCTCESVSPGTQPPPSPTDLLPTCKLSDIIPRPTSHTSIAPPKPLVQVIFLQIPCASCTHTKLQRAPEDEVRVYFSFGSLPANPSSGTGSASLFYTMADGNYCRLCWLCIITTQLWKWKSTDNTF